MPGVYTLLLVVAIYGGSGAPSVSTTPTSDFKYNWEACLQAGEELVRQRERVSSQLNLPATRMSYVCSPLVNTVVPRGISPNSYPAPPGERRPLSPFTDRY